MLLLHIFIINERERVLCGTFTLNLSRYVIFYA